MKFLSLLAICHLRRHVPDTSGSVPRSQGEVQGHERWGGGWGSYCY